MKNLKKFKLGKLSGNKKKVSSCVLAAGTIIMAIAPQSAFAHGFVEKPGSRVALCSPNYGALNSNCGKAMYDIQSLEATKGFPVGGPIDGKIASAGGLFEGILDQQTADRWYKNVMKGGPNTFTWKYTEAHRTSKWHYYITKKGWDPNKPLTRADFELIGTVEHDGSKASNNLTHTVNVPTDRSGYYVILAVWDVADTSNAFYNVIDVNLMNDVTPTKDEKADIEAPTKPTEFHAKNITSNSIELSWKASTDNVGVKEYQILRNGQLLQTVAGTSFTDTNLTENMEYRYTVKAVDAAGNISTESESLVAKTAEKTKNTGISVQPTGLHTMGVTSSSVDLMWNISDENEKVEYYNVYREAAGEQVMKVGTSHTTSFEDKSVKPNQTYKYVVTAVDSEKRESTKSNVVTVTTKEATDAISSYEKWNPYQTYEKGDKVEYQGNIYEAVQGHQGMGDLNWIFALALWKPVTIN